MYVRVCVLREGGKGLRERERKRNREIEREREMLVSVPRTVPGNAANSGSVLSTALKKEKEIQTEVLTPLQDIKKRKEKESYMGFIVCVCFF